MVYFDTSFLAPLLLEEATSEKVEAYVCRLPTGELYASRWTCLEFASLVAREVRMGGLPATDAREVLKQFDAMIDESFRIIVPDTADFLQAQQFIQKFDSGLRARDALHLAIARNRDAEMLLTLDSGLLKAGEILGVKVGRGIAVQ